MVRKKYIHIQKNTCKLFKILLPTSLAFTNKINPLQLTFQYFSTTLSSLNFDKDCFHAEEKPFDTLLHFHDATAKVVKKKPKDWEGIFTEEYTYAAHSLDRKVSSHQKCQILSPRPFCILLSVYTQNLSVSLQRHHKKRTKSL